MTKRKNQTFDVPMPVGDLFGPKCAPNLYFEVFVEIFDEESACLRGYEEISPDTKKWVAEVMRDDTALLDWLEDASPEDAVERSYVDAMGLADERYRADAAE